MTLGEKLKLFRVQKEMTQEAFAEKINVSRSAVAKWESDKGIPEISNLKQISLVLDISLDELLADKICDSKPECKEAVTISEYTGYYCDIDLAGWNDGMYGVLVLGEDRDFLFYEKHEKNKKRYGLLGKKYITSIERHSKSDVLNSYDNINRDYFCNRHVVMEIAHREGFFSGFFDFRNDDYLDVVVNDFKNSKIILKFGSEVDTDAVTKMEEL